MLYTGRALVYEQQLLTTLRQQFDQQRRDILGNASTKALKGYKRRDDSQDGSGVDYGTYSSPGVSKQDKKDWLAALLLWPTYDDAMRKAIAPILYALIVETGKQAMGQVNLDPSMFNPTTVEILNYYTQRAAKIATDVNDETEKQLRASLGQGIDAGESDDELAARIEDVMGAALTYRADRIAKTETTRAQGFGDIEAWTQAGTVTGKEWFVQSNNPCAFCRSLNGTIVSLDSNFYSLGDVITADGKTMAINYDNVPTPPIHVRCQCIVLPIMVTL